jgi:hypothetical protein
MILYMILLILPMPDCVKNDGAGAMTGRDNHLFNIAHIYRIAVSSSIGDRLGFSPGLLESLFPSNDGWAGKGERMTHRQMATRREKVVVARTHAASEITAEYI